MVKSFCSSSLLEAIMHLEKNWSCKEIWSECISAGGSLELSAPLLGLPFILSFQTYAPKWLSKSTSIDAIGLSTPKNPPEVLGGPLRRGNEWRLHYYL